MNYISIAPHTKVSIPTDGTIHFNYERQFRFDFVRTHIGVGNVLYCFLVDKGHPRGPKIECVTDTGIVVLVAKDTNEIITVMVAKPSQIMEYWFATNQPIPADIRPVLTKAREHVRKGWNLI